MSKYFGQKFIIRPKSMGVRTGKRRIFESDTAQSVKRAKLEEENSEEKVEAEKEQSVKVGAIKLLLNHSISVAKKDSDAAVTAKIISKKLASHAKFSQKTPFPDFIHPTAAECRLAHQILCSIHGARIRPQKVIAPSTRAGCGNSPSVLDALVRTILSQNTNDMNSMRAKCSMDRVYGCSDKWEVIIAGGQSKLQETIQSGGLSKVKSRIIMSILNQVHARYGKYSLDHLHSVSNDEAMQELLSFKGVGPKTASCVLLFSLQRASFAVDTHVWRITGLLGWRPASAGRDETFRHLDARIPDEEKYGLHILLVTHGKNCPECRAGGEAEGKCKLRIAFGRRTQDDNFKKEKTNGDL